jgi:hypothetical protein
MSWHLLLLAYLAVWLITSIASKWYGTGLLPLFENSSWVSIINSIII